MARVTESVPQGEVQSLRDAPGRGAHWSNELVGQFAADADRKEVIGQGGDHSDVAVIIEGRAHRTRSVVAAAIHRLSGRNKGRLHP